MCNALVLSNVSYQQCEALHQYLLAAFLTIKPYNYENSKFA